MSELCRQAELAIERIEELGLPARCRIGISGLAGLVRAPDAAIRVPGERQARMARGCLLDSDNDGVANINDRCPGTPEGRIVDVTGCEPDRDLDGVIDSRDLCPGTPPGAEVDADGCQEIVEIELPGVLFATNSAELLPESADTLDDAAEKLRAHDALRIEVAGHTDDRGAEAYNLELSKQRAVSVRAYLIERGIAADRMIAEGYGEADPVASNDSGKPLSLLLLAHESGGFVSPSKPSRPMRRFKGGWRT